jgi:hypothetical protein
MKKVYSEEYDAYYDEETNEWLEDICEDPFCEYCSERPVRPGAGEKNSNETYTGISSDNH